MSSVKNEITLAEPEVKLEQIMCQMKDLDLISPLISCGLLTVVGQMADYYNPLKSGIFTKSSILLKI